MSFSADNITLGSGLLTMSGGSLYVNQILSLNLNNIVWGNGFVATTGSNSVRIDIGTSGTAPATNSLSLPLTSLIYGTTASLLGSPSGFLAFNLSGVNIKLPYYI